MTAAVGLAPAWARRRLGEVCARIISCGPVLSRDAKDGLLAIVTALATGQEVPSQEELVAAMGDGMTVKRLRAGLEELVDGELLTVTRRGRRPSVYGVCWDVLFELLEGRYSATGAEQEPVCPATGAEQLARAGRIGATSATAAPVEDPAELEYQAILGTLSWWGIRLSAGAKSEIRGWVGRYSVADVRYAAREANAQGSKGWRLVETICRRLHAETALTAVPAGELVLLDEYRAPRSGPGAPVANGHKSNGAVPTPLRGY